jgi:hypothetical protein
MKEQTKLAIEEFRRMNDVLLQAAESLDGKAATIFGSASVVLTILASTQKGSLGAHGDALLVTIGFYILMTMMFFVSFVPRIVKTPVSGDLAALEEEVLTLPANKAGLAVLGGYAEAIKHNQGVTKLKGWLIAANLGILALIVASLVAMAFLV